MGLFQQQLNQPTLSANTLLQALETDTPLSKALFDNRLLSGILLGYGTHNAALYARLAHLETEQAPYCGAFSSSHEEIQEIKKTLCAFDLESDLTPTTDKQPFLNFKSKAKVMLPAFWHDPKDPETAALKTTYQKTTPTLEALLQKPDFLKQVLSTLSNTPFQAIG